MESHDRRTPSQAAIDDVENRTSYTNCRFSTGYQSGILQGTAWCLGAIVPSFHRSHRHRHLAISMRDTHSSKD
ncbi:hypothetical protein HZH68_002445 [Vespula germanica]|uniref:Uncharacterized protein n=1 Tax=Vespula germanica TaxID=30212 RepID=A0A834NMC8_VESGE|nr:hypothetical protein HZH68_002445 [Vespula germanica]